MLFKLIGEKKYTEDCFAYIQDKTNPNKWQFQIKEYDGGSVMFNKDLLIESAKIFEPDSEVKIYEGDVMGIKTAIRNGFRQVGAKDSDIPGSVMESIDIDCQWEEFNVKAFAEAQIDKENHVIKNVVLITRESKNNRVYTDPALDDIARFAEGGKLYLNHQPLSERRDTGGVRKVEDLMGESFNTRRVDQKVIGDIRILESHAKLVFPIAEQMPHQAGFSWTGGGKGHRSGGKEIVESITRHCSVDLVSEPAATKNLFEQLNLNNEGGIDGMKWSEITEAIIKEKAPELYKAITEQNKEKGTMSKDTQEKIEKVIKENTDLKDKVGKLETKAEISESKSTVDKHLDKFISENKLDEKTVADLRTSLIGRTEDQIKEAVTERAIMLKDVGALKLIKGMGPEFKEQNETEVSSKDLSGAVRG